MRSLTLLFCLCPFPQRKDFLYSGIYKGAVDRKNLPQQLPGRGYYGPGVQNIYYDSVKAQTVILLSAVMWMELADVRLK